MTQPTGEPAIANAARELLDGVKTRLDHETGDAATPDSFHEGFVDALTRVIAHPAAVRLRTLLDTVDATHGHPVSAPECDHSGHDCTHYPPGYDQVDGQPSDEPTEADPGLTSAEKLLGESLVDSVKAFGDLGMHVMQTIADGGSLDAVLEATADFMDGRDCVDDESIALFNRAKAVLVGGRSAAPTRDEMIDALNQSIVEQGYGDTDIDPGDLLEALLGITGVLPVAAPTREQVHDAIREAFARWDGRGSVHEQQADAVVALLSRPAAEPPEPQQRLVANRLADELRDMAAQGRARGIAAVATAHDAADELERLVVWLEDARGVAVEPNEEPGDGR